MEALVTAFRILILIAVLLLSLSAVVRGADASLSREFMVHATPQQILDFIAQNRGSMVRGSGVETARVDSGRVLLKKKTAKGPIEVVMQESWTSSGYQTVLVEVRRGSLKDLWATVSLYSEVGGTRVHVVSYARTTGILIRSSDIYRSLRQAEETFEREIGRVYATWRLGRVE